MANAHKLKELQTRRAKLKAEMERHTAERVEAEKTERQCKRRLTEVEKQLKKATRSVTLTEHAMLRYLEAMGILDVENLKAEILTPEMIGAIEALRNGLIPVGNGIRLVVKAGTVVTVVGGARKKSRK